MFRSLLLIEEVEKRIEALSEARGIPVPQANRLKEESQALKWAVSTIKESLCSQVVLLVGNQELVSTAPYTLGASIRENNGIATAFIMADDSIVRDTKRHFVSPQWDGNHLPPGRLPDWIYSDRYFACTRSGERLLLMFGLIDKSHKSYDYDSVDLRLRELFTSLKWEEKRSV
jgi:hypothetical protein